MNECLTYETRDHVATITMNRPEVLNAITIEMIESFCAALAAADGDDDVRVLILTGAGTRVLRRCRCQAIGPVQIGAPPV